GSHVRTYAQPGCDGSQPWCDGEVHDVRAPDPPRSARGGIRGPGADGRRYQDGVSADVPDERHHLRRLDGPGERSLEALEQPPYVSGAERDRDGPGRWLPEGGRWER